MHEPDHEEDEETEDPEVDEHLDSGVRTKPQRQDEDNRDEYSTRDDPIVKSFYNRYGLDERDGPPEEEEKDLLDS